jgi:2-Cys peroxiredoxin 5
MQGWAEAQGVSEDSLLTFMADPYSEVTRALEMELTHPGPLSLGLVNRCKRFALHISDGVVQAVRIAEGPDDPAGDDNPDITCAPSMLKIMKGIGGDEL